MSVRKLVIVGGVAGGASVATRARRLSEEATIVMFERGPYVSFANCGLPYFVGGEIPSKEDLLVETPERLWQRFRIDVRTESEVVRIDRDRKTVLVRDLRRGVEYEESYDALVLATGSSPVRPPIPNLDHKGHFIVRTIPDVEQLNDWIRKTRAQEALVVGGGFIGLEMTEQLLVRGLRVTLVEACPYLFPVADPEISAWLLELFEKKKVTVYVNDPVKAFEEPSLGEKAAASVAVLASGRRIPADVVVLALGTKPETTLAKDAGLVLGQLGGIRVDERLQTSDPNIWAVGDAIEVRDLITGRWTLLPLAGPASRQGRVAADNIFGRDSRFDGVIGTSIVRVFDIAIGVTGATEQKLKEYQIPYFAVHIHAPHHASYYPGASLLHIKGLFEQGTGRLVGAQVVGRAGVDKRIDVLATAIKAKMRADDLADLELAYAPPFGSARDPINQLGMVAQNVLRGNVKLAQWYEVGELDPTRQLLLDVRTASEWRNGRIPGAIHIPLDQLRDRLSELPHDKEIIVSCRSGQRSYFAYRILVQHGFKDVRNLTGSYLTWMAGRRAQEVARYKALHAEGSSSTSKE